MFRMNIPNQSADEQRNEVRRSVRNNVLSFFAFIAMIRAGNKMLLSEKVPNIISQFYLQHQL